jgi:hypothetical protein
MSGVGGAVLLAALMTLSALVVLGLCRAAARAEQTFEKAEARHFADQVEQDLADLTNHTPEEPTP